MRRDGIHGGPNFITWFRQHAIQAAHIHLDLRQLSYGSVIVRSYGRYNVNGYHFRSAKFEASRPLMATCNTGVVTRAVDANECTISYYEIIQDILEFSFAGNKELKVVFFYCDWFDPNRGTR